jgi:transmembrane sensor
MRRKARSKLNIQVYEEACEWFVEFRGGDLDVSARREFDLWVRKSPESLAAYLEIAAIWNEGSSLDPEHKWDTETLIAQAAADADSVVPLPRASLVDLPPYSSSRRLKFAVTVSVVVACVGATLLGWSNFGSRYATGVGEQRFIALSDGSSVEINSRSKIRVRYSAHERAVELLEGQALFQVAGDHTRPFIVSAGGTRDRALGTQFDVNETRGGNVVTVVEGSVAILRDDSANANSSASPGPGTADSGLGGANARHIGVASSNSPAAGTTIFLAAGEQLTLTATIARKTDHPDLATATAWTQRQLVFESAALSDVAEEFNRYNERQLIIQDPALYDFHVSGVFSSTDPASLVRFLRERPGVKVIETATEIRVAKNIS